MWCATVSVFCSWSSHSSMQFSLFFLCIIQVPSTYLNNTNNAAAVLQVCELDINPSREEFSESCASSVTRQVHNINQRKGFFYVYLPISYGAHLWAPSSSCAELLRMHQRCQCSKSTPLMLELSSAIRWGLPWGPVKLIHTREARFIRKRHIGNTLTVATPSIILHDEREEMWTGCC